MKSVGDSDSPAFLILFARDLAGCADSAPVAELSSILRSRHALACFELAWLAERLLLAWASPSSLDNSALRPDSWAFEEVFAVDPPASISGLDASTNPGLDSRAIYLAFESNPAIKAWLTRQTRSWTSVARSDWVDSDAFQGSPPNWWKGASSGFAPHGCARPVHREFRDVGYWRQLAIIDCLSDRRVYVIVQRID